ncbi:MAG: hypothetical protein KGJ02_08035 [Verrucomicrobiota bacterium]|nr:hypothetical protein [Verrucomicrobiota bacterium]
MRSRENFVNQNFDSRRVYLAGSTAISSMYFGGKALVQSLSRTTLTKITASPIIEAATPIATQSTTSKGFILVGEGSLRSASVVRRGQTINRVFDSRHALGRPYSQPWGGSFSPGFSLPNSASQAIVDRGLNWPGVINNAELGAVYRANKNVPCMVRTSLGGTAPEIEISRDFKDLFVQIGEAGIYTKIP